MCMNLTEEQLAVLQKPAKLSLDGETLTLQLGQCSEQDRELLQAMLESAKSNISQPPAVDYSPYFEAVKGSPMYKPANPGLAIRQVAKAYALDVDAFQKAFKAAK